GRGPRRRRTATQGRRASEGRDPRVPAGTSGDAGRVPGRRPARPDPARHGDILVCAPRLAGCEAGFLRFELPRRGPPDVARGGDTEVPRERRRAEPEPAGDLPP